MTLIHGCYFRGTEYEMDVIGSIALSEAGGCGVYEVPAATIQDLTGSQRSEIKKYAQEAGVVLTVNGGVGSDTDISADDPGVRAAGVEYLKRLLQSVHEIGAEVFSGVNYTAWLRRPAGLLPKEEKKRIWDLSVNSMRQVIRTAEDLQIRYCFEVVNRYEEFLLNTAEEGVAFAEQVDSLNAQLLLDTFHMNIEEDYMGTALRYAMEKGRLGHIHVGESNRRIPGPGHSNICWPAFFDTVKQMGYRGYLVMEPFVRMGLSTSLNTCVWRDLTDNRTMEDYMRDVAQGLAFLRAGLE